MKRKSIVFFLLALAAGALSIVDVEPIFGGPNVNYNVPEPFFLTQQPTPNVCWAAAATMMKSWKAKQSMSIQSVVNAAGDPFPALYRTDTGLSRDNKPGFLAALALVAEPPATYSAQGLESKLRLWGPLWITTAEPVGKSFSIHARILVGIMGDGSGSGTTLVIADPADGAKHLETLDTFTAKMAQVAKNDYGNQADVRPLIVHF